MQRKHHLQVRQHHPIESLAIEVPEYWIVDPLEAKVTLLQWEEGWYKETLLVGHQVLVSPTFPDLALTVEQILAAGKEV